MAGQVHPETAVTLLRYTQLGDAKVTGAGTLEHFGLAHQGAE
jgi:hypothetical protein